MYVSDPGVLEKTLMHYLSSGRIVIACIGSPLRMDDRAGLLVYEGLRDIDSERVRVVECVYGLENCINEILEFRPEKLLLIDAVYVEDAEPGSIILSSIENIRDGVWIATTHNIPVKLVLETIISQTPVKEIYVLGIVVENTGFGEEVSPHVSRGVNRVISIIRSIIDNR